MQFVRPARHLLRAKDLADARYATPLGVHDEDAALAFYTEKLGRRSGARPYGMDSSFRDPSGNHLRLTQVREVAAV